MALKWMPIHIFLFLRKGLDSSFFVWIAFFTPKFNLVMPVIYDLLEVSVLARSVGAFIEMLKFGASNFGLRKDFLQLVSQLIFRPCGQGLLKKGSMLWA